MQKGMRASARPGIHGSNQNIRYYCNASKLRAEVVWVSESNPSEY